MAALFRCNACFIKFTEELALEVHILAQHSSGTMHSDAESLIKCKSTVDVEYPVATFDSPVKLSPPKEPTTRRGSLKTYQDEYITIYENRTVPSQKQPFTVNEQKRVASPETVLLKVPSPEPKSNIPVLEPEMTADKRFRCNLCVKTFTRKESLQYHFFSHTGEKPFKCSLCAASFRAKPTLRNHLRTVHNYNQERPTMKIPVEKQQQESNAATCALCSKRFKTKFRLNIHMHSQHGDLPFECSVCLKKFPIISRLEVHMRLHTSETASTDLQKIKPAHAFSDKLGAKPKQFQEVFGNQVTSAAPVFFQALGKVPKSICNGKLNGKGPARQDGGVQAHNSDVTNGRSQTQIAVNATSKFRCGKCDVMFPFKCRLKAHMAKCPHKESTAKRVPNPKLAARKCHTCPQCGKKFTMQKNLQSHIVYTHSVGKMRYRCNKCDKSFHHQCRLKIHEMKMHS